MVPATSGCADLTDAFVCLVHLCISLVGATDSFPASRWEDLTAAALFSILLPLSCVCHHTHRPSEKENKSRKSLIACKCMSLSSDNDVDSVALRRIQFPTSRLPLEPQIEWRSGTTTTPLLVRQRKDSISRWSPRKQEKLLLRLLVPQTSFVVLYYVWSTIISYGNMYVFGCLTVQTFEIV